MAENSTAQELKRLLELQTPELIKEFNESRERFREYLRKHGIEVPNMLIVDQPQGVSGEPGRSILLDDFNAQTIKAIDKSVITVYSTADSFLKLFEQIPSSQALENMTVTIDGKPPCTAKDLSEQVKTSVIPKDAQLVVASSDLKALLGDLEPKSQAAPEKGKGKESTKVAALDDSDFENIYDTSKNVPPAPQKAAPAAPKQPEPAPAPQPQIPSKPIKLDAPPPPLIKPKDDAQAEKSQDSKAAQGKSMPPSSRMPLPSPLVMLSPSISQQDFNELFNMDEDDFAKLSAGEETSSEPAPNLNQNELDALLSHVESITASEETPAPASLDQSELDALLSVSKPATPAKAPSSSVDQNEIDALLSAAKPAKSVPPPKAPQPQAKPEPKNENLSQNELDALFGAPQKTVPAPAAKPDTGAVDQSEIDALLNATKAAPTPKVEQKNESLSQNELDALFGAPQKTATAPAAKPDSTAVDQSEIDALLNTVKSAPVAENKPESSSVGQSEIDALLNAGKKPEPPATPKATVKNENLSQNDLDALFASMNPAPAKKESPKKAEPEIIDFGVSQEELDKAISAKPEPPKSFGIFDVADDSEGISQDAIDKAFGVKKPNTKTPVFNPQPSLKKEPEMTDSAEISQEELDKIFGKKK